MIAPKKHVIRTFAILASLLWIATVQAGERLFVVSPAIFGPYSAVPQKIKKECAMETKFADHVREEAAKKFDTVIAVKDTSDAGPGKVMTLTILQLEGVSGGGWTGSKSITAEATLQEGDKLIGTFTDTNSSRGGILGPVQGTCAILDRAAEHLSIDIVKWAAETIGLPNAGRETTAKPDNKNDKIEPRPAQ